MSVSPVLDCFTSFLKLIATKGLILRRALWKDCKRLPRLTWYLVSWASAALLLALSSGSLSEQIPKVDPASLQDFPHGLGKGYL